MNFATVYTAMRKRAAVAAARSMYDAYDANAFTPEQQALINNAYISMGMKGPVQRIKRDSAGNIVGINGIGLAKPLSLNAQAQPPAPSLTPAPIQAPNTKGMSVAQANAANRDWAKQEVARREQAWKQEAQQKRQQAIDHRNAATASNNALRGQRMTGKYYDKKLKKWVDIDGTAGGNNFTQAELNEIQPPVGGVSARSRNTNLGGGIARRSAPANTMQPGNTFANNAFRSGPASRLGRRTV